MSDVIRPTPRYPPSRLTPKQIRLFQEAYPEKEKSLAIITMIERHLAFLDERGDHEHARDFLAAECDDALQEAKRLGVERRRAAFRNVLGVGAPIVITVKAILSFFGIG